MTKAAHQPALDPAREIIDPHLHLWDIGPARSPIAKPQTFLLRDAVAALDTCGHAITHTVFVECGTMYRAGGPPQLRSLGETEFANGAAAMAASGRYGRALVAHRIVGHVDLLLGNAAQPVLEAHMAAAGERFVGARNVTAFSETGLFGAPCDVSRRGILGDRRFREGAAAVAMMGLGLDVWCLHRQLRELIELADAIPNLAIVLDHLGSPETAPDSASFDDWRSLIRKLAERPNVRIKLGGLGMNLAGPITGEEGAASGTDLAELWRPWIETGIAAFGPERAMFESNFPPDKAAGSYAATWNAFKIIAEPCSEEEKDWLFRRTAADMYRIALTS